MHPVAMDILALLNILQNRDFDILFCWIPGHVGIVGNNLADNAAKTASSFLQREIPCCDAKKSFVRRLQSLWQESWDRQTNNKLHILKPTISSWPCMPVRELDVKVTILRIGHTRFTHRHLLFGERAPTCSRCQGRRGSSPLEAVAALFASCFSWTAIYPHVLAVRGDPLDGWYISVPGVSIGWYPSLMAGLLKGIKQRGHSLGLALRVVTVPGGDSESIGSG
ncbi:hypothetical protein AVEN_240390-1 [Araneus ventricosus]|uniref:RNase H type-1 domain-containing protein n=1 Tax=Araneus ventricosus TaxID=182803 RepID=A0A4Y2F0I4_ARAVE|nr:hypothetical protein AVEN_240390-1 [Araneus ventricosus]